MEYVSFLYSSKTPFFLRRTPLICTVDLFYYLTLHIACSVFSIETCERIFYGQPAKYLQHLKTSTHLPGAYSNKSQKWLQYSTTNRINYLHSKYTTSEHTTFKLNYFRLIVNSPAETNAKHCLLNFI